jgi:outer membrane lipoprotein SlyB
MSIFKFKKSLIPAAALAVIALSACGPAPTAQQAAVAPPPAATAPAPVAAAVPPPAPAPVPQAAPPPPPVAAAPAPVHHHKTQVAQSEPQQSYSQPVQQQAPQAAPVCGDCGVIASVQDVRQKGDAGVVGTLGGAAAGGLLGNQFGHGKGKTAMTVLGAVGGAFAGREVQSQVTAKTVHQVTVNMDDGSQRTVTVDSLNGLGVGSKVRVQGSSLQYNGN